MSYSKIKRHFDSCYCLFVLRVSLSVLRTNSSKFDLVSMILNAFNVSLFNAIWIASLKLWNYSVKNSIKACFLLFWLAKSKAYDSFWRYNPSIFVVRIRFSFFKTFSFLCILIPFRNSKFCSVLQINSSSSFILTEIERSLRFGSLPRMATMLPSYTTHLPYILKRIVRHIEFLNGLEWHKVDW